MHQHYQHILSQMSKHQKLLAVLIDPEDMLISKLPQFMAQFNQSIADYIFVGGSTVDSSRTDLLVAAIKKYTDRPVILFPGDHHQISEQADALLFLSLISGRNAEYLIGQHVASISKLRKCSLEIISTGYILIDGGNISAVQRVTHTEPMAQNAIQKIVDTAKAGAFLGLKLIYLEAGSGALMPVSADIISAVKSDVNLPLIVGGGIRSVLQLKEAYQAGADMVVIGNAFENDFLFFDQLQTEVD